MLWVPRMFVLKYSTNFTRYSKNCNGILHLCLGYYSLNPMFKSFPLHPGEVLPISYIDTCFPGGIVFSHLNQNTLAQYLSCGKH